MLSNSFEKYTKLMVQKRILPYPISNITTLFIFMKRIDLQKTELCENDILFVLLFIVLKLYYDHMTIIDSKVFCDALSGIYTLNGIFEKELILLNHLDYALFISHDEYQSVVSIMNIPHQINSYCSCMFESPPSPKIPNIAQLYTKKEPVNLTTQSQPIMPKRKRILCVK